MATTTQVLRLQSDQILDGPTIGSAVNLKNLTETNRLKIIWRQPAVDPSPLFLRDPGTPAAAVGTVAITNGLATVVGTATTFLTTFAVGQTVEFGNQIGTYYIIQTITDDLNLTLTSAFSGTTTFSTTIAFPYGDAVVYEAAAQVLKNKNMDDPSNTMPDQPQYLHLAGQSGGQTAIGGTGNSENLILRSTSALTKGQVQIDQDDLYIGSGKNVLMNGGTLQTGGGSITTSGGAISTSGGELTGLPALPSGPTSAASKAYVDTSISGGVAWKETLLSALQLDNTNKAIAQADAFFLINNPVPGDTFIIKDSGTTETWTFQAVAASFQPAIGGTALLTMQNLASRINTDSTEWAAQCLTTLQSINVGGVVVIYRKVPTATVTDRIYGTFAVPADANYVNYGTASDYRNNVAAPLHASDPIIATFGLSRVLASLTPGEAHIVRAEDNVYLWNEDADAWQLSGGATVLATSGPGGATIGQATYDSLKGLLVTAGVTEVKVDSSTVSFNGSGQLQVTGGAVPVATSAPGGGALGRATADESFGLQIVPSGILKAKVDGVTVVFDGSGNLSTSGTPVSPTGLVSLPALLTVGIPGVTLPVVGAISTDIPTLQFQHLQDMGQMFTMVVPTDYDSGSIDVLVVYKMASASAANMRLQTQAKIVKTTGTIDTASFPATDQTFTPPNDALIHRSTLLSLTNPGGTTFQRGDTIQFYIKRLGTDGADTHLADWIIVGFEYRYTGQVATRVGCQAADIFLPVSGETTPPAGFISADIPTIDYDDAADMAACVFFTVPDQWDGFSDAFFRIQYAMGGVAGGNVQIRTSGNIVDVVTGSVPVLSAQDYIEVTNTSTNPKRTGVIRTIPAASLSKGSIIEFAIKRITAVGGNNPSDFRVVNVTMDIGITPVSGVSFSSYQYLTDGVFGNASGTVVGDTTYPSFAGDFERWYTMSSSSAAATLHVAFEGKLSGSQTQVSSISLFIKGSGATPQYNVKVYAEGSGALPVYTSGLTAAPGTSTALSIGTALMSAQPTGNKRYFVVVEASIDASESVSVSLPVVSQV